MFLIWGVSPRKKVLNLIKPDVCSKCQKHTNMSIVKTYSVGTIFFIPVFFLTTGYFAVCPECGEVKKLKKSEYKEAKRAFENGIIEIPKTEVMESNNINEGKIEQTELSNAVVCQPAQTHEKIDFKENSSKISLTETYNLILQEVKNTIKTVKSKNYNITPEKIAKLKLAIKQTLLKKYGSEKLIDMVIEEAFINL